MTEKMSQKTSQKTSRPNCQCQARAQIVNERGLHARAAARFAKLAESFDADIAVSRAGQHAAGDSILSLLTLGAGPGSEVMIAAKGPAAAEAVKALEQLVRSGFGEEK